MIPQDSWLGRLLIRLQDRLIVWTSDRERASPGWHWFTTIANAEATDPGERYVHHVIPVRDLVEHDVRPGCICGPFRLSHDRWQHKALDDREMP